MLLLRLACLASLAGVCSFGAPQPQSPHAPLPVVADYIAPPGDDLLPNAVTVPDGFDVLGPDPVPGDSHAPQMR